MVNAIILAAGSGTRSKVSNKQYALLGGAPMFKYSLEKFHGHPEIEQIVLVIPKSDHEKVGSWLDEWKISEVILVSGGATRQESARAGFKRLGNIDDECIVIVHNAANPFVTSEEITQVIQGAEKSGAAFVAHPATNTLKETHLGKVVKTLDRTKVWHAQTPQAFRAELYERALEKTQVESIECTDEMSLIEALGEKPQVIVASENNFKITTARDLEFARFLVEGQETRTGIGLDSHRFDREHRGLMLGGVHLLGEPKTDANSDGDVMIHALCNAIFQAMGEGSLGTFANEMFFQDGITNSVEYLNHVLEKMTDEKFAIQNVGFQIEGKTPQIDPITDQLKSRLSELLSIDTAQIGITATTGEDLTPFGRGEGIQCLATVTLTRRHA